VVDIGVASLALVLLAPVVLMTGILIRLLLGPPIIAREKCMGLGGRVFDLFKFRTERGAMPVNNLVDTVATVLRSSGIDKLPRLYNVMRGDMSLVGPELVGAQYAAHYDIEGRELLLARPGLVDVRHADHILRPSSRGIGVERLYIMRWSLWLDLRILLGACIRAADPSRPIK
jgi:lipopolysaccharide/colanic/teichoic acid biosynthesis glycosyltransferase